MSAKTYFISADGQHDSFETGTASYYVTNVVTFIYGVGVVASLALVLSAQVLHTHTRGNDYGPLYSDRYVTPWWWSLLFAVLRVFMFMCVCSLLLYRKTGGWCIVIWMVPITLFILIDVGSLLILGTYLGACNGSGIGNFNNPCNSYVWCCDPRIYSNPDNHCRPTATCPAGQAATLEQMRPNSIFLWLFALSVVAMVFDVYFFMLPFITTLSGARALRSAFDVASERFAKRLWLGLEGDGRKEK